MLILYGKTVSVVGRVPNERDMVFLAQAVQWNLDWVKAGRPQSNRGLT